MAKSKKAAAQTDRDTEDSGVEQQVLKFAEQLGWLVGTVQAKSEGWLDRKALSAQVSRIRDSASELMTQLAEQGSQRLQGSMGSQSSKSSQIPRSSQGSKGSVKAPVEGKRKTAGGAKKRTMAAAKPDRGLVDAPGKRHRQAPPSAPGIKKSDQSIAKEALWRNKRLRNPRG